jgi:hypothetical protein
MNSKSQRGQVCPQSNVSKACPHSLHSMITRHLQTFKGQPMLLAKRTEDGNIALRPGEPTANLGREGGFGAVAKLPLPERSGAPHFLCQLKPRRWPSWTTTRV